MTLNSVVAVIMRFRVTIFLAFNTNHVKLVKARATL